MEVTNLILSNKNHSDSAKKFSETDNIKMLEYLFYQKFAMEKIWTNLHINKSSNKKNKPVKVENYTQNSLYRS